MLELQKIKRDINWLIDQIKCLIRKSDLNSPLSATAWSENHNGPTEEPYNLDCFVWFEGDVYKSLINNNIYPPTNATYWANLGLGHLLLEEQTDWNATTGRALLKNKPDLSQYALDENLVHKTGNETIDGIKTFVNSIDLIGDSKRISVGSSDSETGFSNIGVDELGMPYVRLSTSSSENTGEIRADNISTNSIYQLPNQSGTIAIDEGLVHKTGNEIIAGIKTFNEDLIVNDLTIGKGNGNNPYNTAIGVYSLVNNTTGFDNTAIGLQALYNNTTGGKNIAIGLNALSNNITGDQNIAIGHAASTLNDNDSNSIVIGAGNLGLGSNTTSIGNSATTTTGLYGNIRLVSGMATAPTSATSPGILGDIRVTVGFIYVCIATNTWVRTELTTW
jgi:hypothetical protein